MARNLALKTNVDAPDVPYPFGRIRDNPGDNTGTPYNELLYGDFHQFMAKMFDNSGLTYNNIADNATDGFQFFDALSENINKFKGFSTYGSNQVLTVDDVGKYVRYFNFFGGATFTLPNPSAALIGKKLFIQNIVPYDLNIIQGVGVLTPTQTWVLNQWDIMELTCIDANTWYVTSVYRKINSDSIRKIIPIGDWDMNTNGTLTVAHGVTLSKIRNVSASVIIDTGIQIFPLTGYVNLTPGGSVFCDASNVNLFRFSNAQAAYTGSLSAFQNASFSATSFNRGWITIEYAI